MQLPKDQNFARRGAFPLFLLLIIGVVVAVGGTYIVREQFLKEGKSGKTAYDEVRIKEQIKNPQKLSEVAEEPKGELAAGPYTSTISQMPSFSITPPAGWEKLTPGGITQIQFKAPDEDRVDQEDGLYAQAKPQVSVIIQKNNGKSLEDIVATAKNTVTAPFEKMTIITEKAVKYAGLDAYLIEAELEGKGVGMRSKDYFLITGDYFIHTNGTALSAFWSKREPAISGSLATFRLL